MKTLMVIFCCVFSTIGTDASIDTQTTSAPRAIEVATIFCELQTLEITLDFPGIVAPKISGKLTSEISGIVTRIKKQLGQSVKKNEVVFFLKNNTTGLGFNEYAVRAPVSGIVSELDIYEGQFIPAGEITGSVTALDQAKIIVEVPSADLPQLHTGLKAKFFFTDQAVDAKVVALSPIIDVNTGTAKMELNPIKMANFVRAGIVGKVKVWLPTTKKFIVPPTAIVSINAKNFVRIVTQEDKALLQEIKLGKLINNQQIIESGITEHQEIITSASDFIKDGDPIKRISQPAVTQ